MWLWACVVVGVCAGVWARVCVWVWELVFCGRSFQFFVFSCQFLVFSFWVVIFFIFFNNFFFLKKLIKTQNNSRKEENVFKHLSCVFVFFFIVYSLFFLFLSKVEKCLKSLEMFRKCHK